MTGSHNLSDFNSIKVRLKHHHRFTILIHHHFNSIKVRLKPMKASDMLRNNKFQFHKGTIKTTYPSHPTESQTNFNSIKVRLKHDKGAD